MNTSALKTFAQEARKKLRQQIGTRLDYWLQSDSAEHRQFAPQIKELQSALEKEGREVLIERVAYTWFNRLAALRFMDANGYHPFGVRVVTPATEQQTMPELLQQARAEVLDEGLRAELPTPETYDLLIAGRMPIENPEAEAYRLLLFAVSHYYHRLMPFLFEKLGDATELLLPGDLLTEQSILADFRESLSDDDCREVEVIGWLYQFYISEKKAEVDARKTAVPKEDIPAVTQLFTPHWIVRYLVENSLGRLWLLNRPYSGLREHMPYYIENEPETDFLKIGKPEEIRLVDPACGSGHMLTYAFDLLYRIYADEGYDAPEIPSLILQHNLYGLEICDRAAALAAFALCMKARSCDKRFFRRLAGDGVDVPRPKIIELQDVHFLENELRDYIRALGLGDLFNQPMLKLLYQFEEAKNFGSLIQPCVVERTIAFAKRVIEAKDLAGQLFLRGTHVKVLRVLQQAEALAQTYHCAIANPPYMGSGSINTTLKLLAEQHYKDELEDIYCMFLTRLAKFTSTGGVGVFVAMQSWMFGDRFKKFRAAFVQQNHLLTLAQFGAHAFDTISGEIVQTAAASFQRQPAGDRSTIFDRLVNGANEEEKRTALLLGSNRIRIACNQFSAVQDAPLVYWLSPHILALFESKPALSESATTRKGMVTAGNEKYVRFWHEVSRTRTCLNARNRGEAKHSEKKWFPYVKGGAFRKWAGNHNNVVDWLHDGHSMRTALHHSGRRLAGSNFNLEFIFNEGITWSNVSSSSFGCRFQPAGSLFDQKGSMLFATEDASLHIHLLGYLNSVIATTAMAALCPTLDVNSGSISKLPFDPTFELNLQPVKDAVAIARADWDCFETSWDFCNQSLLRPRLKGQTLEASWRNWEAQSTADIRRMRELETENNRLFIAAYGLEGELQPEVPEEQITLARADARKDAAALVSYAVGCMMGRYSLDQTGLILADAGAIVQDYLAKVPHPTFAPDADGILPVLNGEWFPDDVVARMTEFLRVVWGQECERENVLWLENALGKLDKKTGKTKPTDLRTYFVRDFYANHLSNERAYGYKKRPIYWLISSPEGSFQALLYMHRYTRDTVNVLLQDYLRAFIHKLEEKDRHLTAVTINEAARPSERTAATKDLGKIQKMLKELQNWERDVVLPLAQQRIEIDLDDGVKVNYLKFPGLLAKISGLEKKEDE